MTDIGQGTKVSPPSVPGDDARRLLAEAEEAIRVVVHRVLRVKTGEPRQELWDLLKFIEAWQAKEPAVRRALGER